MSPERMNHTQQARNRHRPQCTVACMSKKGGFEWCSLNPLKCSGVAFGGRPSLNGLLKPKSSYFKCQAQRRSKVHPVHFTSCFIGRPECYSAMRNISTISVSSVVGRHSPLWSCCHPAAPRYGPGVKLVSYLRHRHGCTAKNTATYIRTCRYARRGSEGVLQGGNVTGGADLLGRSSVAVPAPSANVSSPTSSRWVNFRHSFFAFDITLHVLYVRPRSLTISLLAFLRFVNLLTVSLQI